MVMVVLPALVALAAMFAVAMYVMFDGFDLGIGILFLRAPSEAERTAMMDTVEPIWDGNETWLVAGGVILFGGFPAAYHWLLSSFFLPLMVMLAGLVLRGVSFELRDKARHHGPWDFAFTLGSLMAAFAQGVVLGTFIHAFSAGNGLEHIRPYAWASWFSLLTGLALIAGYGMLGATWLTMKTEGGLRDWARREALRFTVAAGGSLVGVSIWTVLLSSRLSMRWFTPPFVYAVWVVPLAAGLCGLLLLISLLLRQIVLPFVLAMGLFQISYLGLGITLWPTIVPPSLSLWDAAAPFTTQVIMLIGLAATLPVILSYQTYNYWVFSGPVSSDSSQGKSTDKGRPAPPLLPAPEATAPCGETAPQGERRHRTIVGLLLRVALTCAAVIVVAPVLFHGSRSSTRGSERP